MAKKQRRGFPFLYSIFYFLISKFLVLSIDSFLSLLSEKKKNLFSSLIVKMLFLSNLPHQDNTRCIVGRDSYVSGDILLQVWYSNVPHTRLVEDKGGQNWITRVKDKFRFPGGGTQFIHGANQYLDQISKVS